MSDEPGAPASEIGGGVFARPDGSRLLEHLYRLHVEPPLPRGATIDEVWLREGKRQLVLEFKRWAEKWLKNQQNT